MERLINFAMSTMIGKGAAPIVALTVVEDDEEAQPRLLQARSMLEKAIQMAASADKSIEITATIDQNIASGIKRVARERFVSDIIMGWPGKDNLSDILFGRTFDSVVHQTAQLVFITRFAQPLSLNKRILIHCPEFVEKETGFKAWLLRILSLCASHNLAVVFFAHVETFRAAEAVAHESKTNVSVTFFECNDILARKPWIKHAGQNDIVALVSSRVGGISYAPWLEALPAKIVRSMPNHSLIFIYPASRAIDTFSSYTQIDHGGFLEKGWDMLKGAKGILRKS